MVTKLGVGPTVTMDYDAEGNMKDTSYPGSGPSLTWIYDAEGQRAQQRVNGGSWTLYIHDAFGQLAATYNNNGVTPACTTCYLTYDMLGSVRLVTDQNQNVVARHDFIPFGEEIPDGTAGRSGNFAYTSNVTQAFTGQEEDGGNAALHYFNARHLSGALGSFMQPDPGNAGADLTHPQSWNGYAYVMGNPLTFTDPSGMSVIIKDPGEGDEPCFVFDASCAGPGPVPCWECVGGTGGGGAPSSGGAAGGSGPLPPGSFPGGETLGLPPGWSLPGPFSSGLDPFIFSFCPQSDPDCDFFSTPLFTFDQCLSKIPLYQLLFNSHTCSSGVTVRGGAGRVSVGLDMNTRSGVTFAGKVNAVEVGQAGVGVSLRNGKTSLSGSFRIPETIFSVGGSYNEGGLSSINVGARLLKYVNVQVYQTIHVGQVGDTLSANGSKVCP